MNDGLKYFLLVAGVFAVVPVGVSFAGQIEYSVAVVPWSPSAINNTGIILFGGATSLGDANLEYPPGPYGFNGNAMNESGAVAGYASLADGSSPYGTANGPAAAVWQGSQVSILPALQNVTGVYAQAMGINNRSLVVGYSAADADVRAVKWSNGIVQDLSGFLNVPGRSVAQAINDKGQVVITLTTQGSLLSATNDQSYLLDNGVATPISAATATGVHGQAINQSGKVAGTAYYGDGTSSAFTWDGGNMVLGASLFPGITGQNVATGINGNGDVVGYFFPSDHSNATAFIWKNGSSPIDLNAAIDPELGIQIYAAYGINDQGQIVGAGFLNGQLEGFVLTPSPSATGVFVPEPASVSVLLLGGMVLLRPSRRRD